MCDIYSSSKLKKSPKTIKTATSRCHESFKHFNTKQTEVDTEFLVMHTSNRPFRMIHCIPRSDQVVKQSWHTSARVTARKQQQTWPLLRHGGYYRCIIISSKTLTWKGTSGMRRCVNSKHLFNTLRSGYVITIV